MTVVGLPAHSPGSCVPSRDSGCARRAPNNPHSRCEGVMSRVAVELSSLRRPRQGGEVRDVAVWSSAAIGASPIRPHGPAADSSLIRSDRGSRDRWRAVRARQVRQAETLIVEGGLIGLICKGGAPLRRFFASRPGIFIPTTAACQLIGMTEMARTIRRTAVHESWSTRFVDHAPTAKSDDATSASSRPGRHRDGFGKLEQMTAVGRWTTGHRPSCDATGVDPIVGPATTCLPSRQTSGPDLIRTLSARIAHFDMATIGRQSHQPDET